MCKTFFGVKRLCTLALCCMAFVASYADVNPKPFVIPEIQSWEGSGCHTVFVGDLQNCTRSPNQCLLGGGGDGCGFGDVEGVFFTAHFLVIVTTGTKRRLPSASKAPPIPV